MSNTRPLAGNEVSFCISQLPLKFELRMDVPAVMNEIYVTFT